MSKIDALRESLVRRINESVLALNTNPTDEECYKYLSNEGCLNNIEEDLFNGCIYHFGVKFELNEKAQKYFEDWYENRFEGFNI